MPDGREKATSGTIGTEVFAGEGAKGALISPGDGFSAEATKREAGTGSVLDGAALEVLLGTDGGAHLLAHRVANALNGTIFVPELENVSGNIVPRDREVHHARPTRGCFCKGFLPTDWYQHSRHEGNDERTQHASLHSITYCALYHRYCHSGLPFALV